MNPFTDFMAMKEPPSPRDDDFGIFKVDAGGGIRTRDFWAPLLEMCSPDHESGALTRLGYPGLTLVFCIS